MDGAGYYYCCHYHHINSVFAPGMSWTTNLSFRLVMKLFLASSWKHWSCTFEESWNRSCPVLFSPCTEGRRQPHSWKKEGRPTGNLLTWWPLTAALLAQDRGVSRGSPGLPLKKKSPLTWQHHLGKRLILLYTYGCITCLQGKPPYCLWSYLSLLFVQIHSHKSGAIWGNTASLGTAEW